MRLQKLRHSVFPSGSEIIIHAINTVCNSAEFTICGLDTVSSNFEYNDFEKDGKPYEGKIKEVTCEECLKIINFIKKLK